MEENGLDIDSYDLLDILGNPNKRMILAKLAKVPHSASELARDLNISRQAVHVQLKSLEENGVIERLENSGKYRIKKTFSIRVDISPDYFNINYSTSEINETSNVIELENTKYSQDYNKITIPEDKIKFLGKNIKIVEKEIKKLEQQRKDLLSRKECFIVELKNLMDERFKKDLIKTIRKRRNKERLVKESLNLGEEILFTLFFNPEKYFDRINVDNLLDELFSDMDSELREMNKISVKPLLSDLSKLMGFLQKKDDDWFFNF